MHLVNRTWYFYLAEMLRTFQKIIISLILYFCQDFLSFHVSYPIPINIHFPPLNFITLLSPV